MKKRRMDAWDVALTEAQRWEAYEKAKGVAWTSFATWVEAEYGVRPGKNAIYDWLAYMRRHRGRPRRHPHRGRTPRQNPLHLRPAMTAAKSILESILLPYQLAWVWDGSRFKIGLWSRQTGKSFATAAEAVLHCQLHPGTLWVVLSAGERQAIEWMRKARQWAEAVHLTLEAYDETRPGGNALMPRTEITFANRSRIIAIPANPDTARGYSANLVLDEFAIHEKPWDIWAAIYPSITNPLSGQKLLRIVPPKKKHGQQVRRPLA